MHQSVVHKRAMLKRARKQELQLRIPRSPEPRAPFTRKEIRVALMVWLSEDAPC